MVILKSDFLGLIAHSNCRITNRYYYTFFYYISLTFYQSSFSTILCFFVIISLFFLLHYLSQFFFLTRSLILNYYIYFFLLLYLCFTIQHSTPSFSIFNFSLIKVTNAFPPYIYFSFARIIYSFSHFFSYFYLVLFIK